MAKATKTHARVMEVIDVAPENPEVALVTAEGSKIGSFVAGLKEFLRVADGYEAKAATTLSTVQALVRPANSTEDERIQTIVRQATADIKEIEQHWTVTSLMHQFHKRLVARRDKGVTMLEKAKGLGNRLHQDYKDAEQRRADEETRRINAENEQKARIEQEQRAAELEQLAVTAEATRADLSERERTFVDLVYAGHGAPQAARTAGFKDPVSRAVVLMATAKIQTAIQAKHEAAALRQQATAKRQEPVVYDDVTVEADITKGGDRSTWSAEVFNERALIQAVIAGQVPVDILCVKQTVLNDYAKKFQHNLDRWPGVKAVKRTSIV